MKDYHVTYYYLATGMEGQADERDYGIHSANSIEEAINKALDTMDKNLTVREKEWVRGCLTAREIY
jgi:hypothetical protein